MKTIVSSFLILLSFMASAQLGFDDDQDAQDPVQVTVTNKVHGDTVLVQVCFDIAEGWILYDSLIGGEGPIPLELEVRTDNGSIKKVRKPHLKKKHDDVFGIDILYLSNRGCYEFPILIQSGTKTTIDVSYTFMSCNMTSGVCLPPVSDSVILRIN